MRLTKDRGTLAEVSQLFILYTVDLDVKMAKRRVQFEDQNTTASGKLLVSKHTCSELQLHPLVRVGRTRQKEGGSSEQNLRDDESSLNRKNTTLGLSQP